MTSKRSASSAIGKLKRANSTGTHHWQVFRIRWQRLRNSAPTENGKFRGKPRVRRDTLRISVNIFRKSRRWNARIVRSVAISSSLPITEFRNDNNDKPVTDYASKSASATYIEDRQAVQRLTYLHVLWMCQMSGHAALLRRLKSPLSDCRNIIQANVTCCGNKHLMLVAGRPGT